MNTMMEHKGFKARVMEAPRLTGDQVHALPPGTPLPVYPVDMLLQPPENWMKGPGVFVIPVRPNKGLWFDWRLNSDNNTAVIPTVKGCNPITGMQTSGFHMERYENKCPKHGCDFLHERFCPECNYKWPSQNYIGPRNTLWWDGFLNQKDGTVRQFFFSEEELRDVASALIGKENTVPAFGFAFYAPKERRSEPAAVYLDGTVYKYADAKKKMFNPTVIHINHLSSTPLFGANLSVNYMETSCSVQTSDGPVACGASAASSEEKTSGGPICSGYKGGGSAITDGESTKSFSPILRKRSFSKSLSSTKCSTKSFDFFEGERERGLRLESSRGIDTDSPQEATKSAERQERKEPVKEVSIGAGAKIDQKLTVDPYELSSWKEAPDSVMTIYFVFQEKFEELKAKGVRDLEGSKEGILSGCIVG